MISRLSAFAAVFAMFATATIAVAAASVQVNVSPSAAVVKAIPIVQLPTVTVVGQRSRIAQ
jgi:hypothetical protein